MAAMFADVRLGLIGAPVFVTWAIAAVAVGGVMHLLSAAADAVRDIARNSFRR